MAAHPITMVSLLVLCVAVVLVSVGCGCQQHEVSAVTVTPPASCLTIHAGGGAPGHTEVGAVGMCESLYLFGENGCADPLVISMPAAAGSTPEQKTAPAGEAFEIEMPGWSERSYDLKARLGSQVLSLRFVIGGQCGLTGSCD